MLVYALVCSGLVGAPGSGRAADEPASPLDRLVAAVGSWRPVEGRLSVALAYAPYDPKTPSPGDPVAIALAAAAIETAAAHEPTPAASHALGLLRLIERRPAEAVSALSQVVEQDRGNGAAWSDLAAAYLARARTADDIHDAVRALDAAETALALSPELPAARFNDGLALGALGLRSAEQESWLRYRRIASDSGWTKEARERLEAAASPGRFERWLAERQALETALLDRVDVHLAEGEMATRYPDLVAPFVRDELLPRWGAAAAEGRVLEAASLVASMRVLCEAVAPAQRDQSVADAVGHLSALRGTEASQALARGLQAFGDAMKRYKAFEIAVAAPLFRSAATDLQANGSPLSQWAAAYHATCLYWQADYPGAIQAFRKLERELPATYRGLRADVRRMLGLLLTLTGDPAEGRRGYQDALESYEAAGDQEGRATARTLLADSLWQFGDLAEAWRILGPGLSMLPDLEPRRQRYVLDEAGFFSESEGSSLASARFHEELLEVSRRIGSPTLILDAQLSLVGLDAGLQRIAQAREALSDAERRLPEVTDESLRLRYSAELKRSEAGLLVDTEPARAIALLNEAAAFFESIGHQPLLADVEVALGRAHANAGHAAEAQASFKKAIETYERQSRDTGDGELGPQDFESLQEAFGAVVAGAIERGQDVEAFDFADRSRTARLLSAELKVEDRGEGRVSGFDLLSQALSPETALLEYDLLPDRTLIFCITRNHLDVRSVPVSRDKLEELVKRFRRALLARDPEARWSPLAHSLYGFLIDPIAASLRPGQQLVIVPHGSLFDLPFAALQDSQGRWLVEAHPLTLAPSARLAALYSRRAPSSSRDNALVVAATTFDEALLSGGGSPLADADAEANRVAGFYRRVMRLAASQATAERFLDEAPLADVIHFAGHALANVAHPELAALLLAPQRDPDRGVLYARAIQRLSLARAPVVVLSGCDTGSGLGRSSEGVGSLARAFLVAGASSVVASVWAVGDAEVGGLMADFHSRLARGSPPALALSEAQISLARGADRALRHPGVWSGFVEFGSLREFSRHRPSNQTKRSVSHAGL